LSNIPIYKKGGMEIVTWKRLLIGFTIIVIVGFIIGLFVYLNNSNNEGNNDIKDNVVLEEYTPQEEISDAQIRQTMISLYFKDDKGLIPEVRYIDVKVLVKNPYEEVLKMLIEGPKTENLKRTIPKETKINKIDKIGDKLIIELSKEFVLNQNEEEKKIAVKSIENTLTQFIEINEVTVKSND
jgi:hypothetical protein